MYNYILWNYAWCTVLQKDRQKIQWSTRSSRQEGCLSSVFDGEVWIYMTLKGPLFAWEWDLRAPVKIIDLIKSDLRNESHITHSSELLITDLIYNFLLIHLDIRLGDTYIFWLLIAVTTLTASLVLMWYAFFPLLYGFGAVAWTKGGGGGTCPFEVRR